MSDKLIVSNRGALRAKYGATGLARVRAALRKLIAADRRRGLVSVVVFLDDARAMRARRARAVVDPADGQATKAAIDALYRTEKPDYLLIVGAHDVVAHQPLRNPLFEPPEDPDRHAFSDLPYACDAPYSTDPAKFVGPTRVVGRLPDLTAATSPRDAAYLIGLIATAAGYRSRPPEHYAQHFALSARSWERSSQRNLFDIFGDSSELRTSPPHGPRFGAGTLGAPTHFINCHGNEGTPEFQGQFRRDFPIALSTRSIAGKIARGTIAAVECCYGAELYAAGVIGTDLPICQSYLAQGAYGYFGSTTIAYGESRTLAAADLIVQHFLLAVLEGASIGRATLIARQRYAEESTELDPTDLKTLAQFTLLGDPSVHPVKVPDPALVPKGVDSVAARRGSRRERRAKLAAMGRFLKATKPTASRAQATYAPPPAVRRALDGIARNAGVDDGSRFRMFPVRRPARATGPQGKAAGFARRYFVAVQKPRGVGTAPRVLAIVARDVGGRIVNFRVYERR